MRPVADAVLAGAAEWWSRDRFAPVIGSLRTAYMRNRLREAADAEDPYLRWAVVEGFRHLTETSAVPLMINRLAIEQWPAIQRALVTTLGRLRDPAAIEPLWAFYERRSQLIDTYTDFYAIGESLGRLGAETLLRTLFDRVDEEPSALDVLNGARPFVPALLRDEIADVLRSRVVLTASFDVERYLEIAKDPAAFGEEEQLDAVRGLGTVGTAGTASGLLDLMIRAESADVIDAAARALRDVEGEVSFADVVDHLYTEYRMAEPRAVAAYAILLLWTSSAQDALMNLSFPEPDRLNEELARDTDVDVRATAVLLSCLGGSVPEGPLLDLAKEEDQLVREAAVGALGHAEITDTVPLLVQLARTDPALRVRLAALRALGLIAPPAKIVSDLGEALNADDPKERRVAAEVLGELGEEAAAPLSARLAREDVIDVRRALIVAAVGVSNPPPPEIVTALLEGLDGDARSRDFAAGMIGHAGITEAAARLHTLMTTDPDETVRSSAAESYGRVASLPMLLALAAACGQGAVPDPILGALSMALSSRPPEFAAQLVARIRETGGMALVTGRATIVRYATSTYITRTSTKPREVDALFVSLTDPDPAARWDAVDELADRWSAAEGVIGRLGVAMLDEDELVADLAKDRVDDIADWYRPDVVDPVSLRILAQPAVFAGLIDLLDSPSSAAPAWLLKHPEFLPMLLPVAVGGRAEVRQVLWDLADRYGLRLFPDGRALLADGRGVSWDELPGVMGSLPTTAR